MKPFKNFFCEDFNILPRAQSAFNMGPDEGMTTGDMEGTFPNQMQTISVDQDEEEEKGSYKHRIKMLTDHIMNQIVTFNGEKCIRNYVKFTATDCKELPFDLSDVIIDGGFDCSGNDLVTLKGCPITIRGYFDCSNNKLTSLKYGPVNVGGDFYDCSYNKITSLDYAPDMLAGDFHCESNWLPKEILGTISAHKYRAFMQKYKLQQRYGNETGEIVNDL